MEQVKFWITQGGAVALVAALVAGVAHYWFTHGFPQKIKKDKANIDLTRKLGDSVQSLAASHQETAGTLESLDGRVKNIEGVIQNGVCKGLKDS